MFRCLPQAMQVNQENPSGFDLPGLHGIAHAEECSRSSSLPLLLLGHRRVAPGSVTYKSCCRPRRSSWAPSSCTQLLNQSRRMSQDATDPARATEKPVLFLYETIHKATLPLGATKSCNLPTDLSTDPAGAASDQPLSRDDLVAQSAQSIDHDGKILPEHRYKDYLSSVPWTSAIDSMGNFRNKTI